MNKYEEELKVDIEGFHAFFLFGKIAELGMFINIWFSQVGVV
jgi:hypothetical protein